MGWFKKNRVRLDGRNYRSARDQQKCKCFNEFTWRSGGGQGRRVEEPKTSPVMKRRMFGGGEKFGGGGDLERRKTTKNRKGGRDLQELFAENDSDAGIAPAQRGKCKFPSRSRCRNCPVTIPAGAQFEHVARPHQLFGFLRQI